MQPKRTQQQLAKDLYLQTDKTQQEIADILDVNRRTVYLWVKNGKWAEIKIAARQTPGIILQDIHNHITAINTRIRNRDSEDHCPTMQEVEMLRKLLNMTAVIEKQHVGAFVEAFQELTSFIYRKDYELAQKVTLYANQYIKGNIGDKNFSYDKEQSENIDDVVNNLANDTEVEDPALPIDENPADEIAPAPPEGNSMGGKCEYDGIMSDNNSGDAIMPPAPENENKPLTINEKDEPGVLPKYPTADFSENEIINPVPVKQNNPVPKSHRIPDPPANEVLGKG